MNPEVIVYHDPSKKPEKQMEIIKNSIRLGMKCICESIKETLDSEEVHENTKKPTLYLLEWLEKMDKETDNCLKSGDKETALSNIKKISGSVEKYGLYISHYYGPSSNIEDSRKHFATAKIGLMYLLDNLNLTTHEDPAKAIIRMARQFKGSNWDD